jgi:predicted nucleotidyltransferase
MPSPDYEAFIAALNAHGVRYLVIGAHAVAFHARPRATKDLDLLIDPTPDNAQKTLSALKDFFGGATLGYTPQDLIDPGFIIQLGIAPVRIDLLSEIPGIPSFEKAWENRINSQFGPVPTYYIGLDDLLCAKEAAGRPQDRADLRILQRARSIASSPPRPRRRRR